MNNTMVERPKTEYETALIPKAQVNQIAEIDATTLKFQMAIVDAEEQGNSTMKALLIARATRTLQKLLTEDLMQDIMALQGTPLGFRTDKDHQGGYKVDVVRDVVIQALIRGFQVTGNQINIIANNLYVTKEGFENRLHRFDGLCDLEVDFQVPDTTSRPGSALVACSASWKLNGKLGQIDCSKSSRGDFRIPIRVNSGMGDDAILGKAKSKLLRKAFERITGMSTSGINEDGSIDAEDVIQSRPEKLGAVEEPTTIDPAPLEPALQDELQAALIAIQNRGQFEACKSHWRSKAKNRDFTQGQLVTIKGMFSDREEHGFE